MASPDTGGTRRANAYAKHLNSDLVICYKQRKKANEISDMSVIGDVKGKTCLLVDDIIDTAGSITKAASTLKKYGAKEIYAMATHPVLSGSATKKLEKSPIKEIFVTNTIELKKKTKKIKVFSVAPLLSETIKRQHEGTPMGIFYDKLYEEVKKKTH